MTASACAGSAEMPARSELPRPSAKFALCTKSIGRPASSRLDALALMAGDHDHRPRPRSERRLDDDAKERPAANLGQKLVRPSHAARAAGGEHQRRDVAGGMHRLFARLRPRDDLHEQAADPHAGNVLARHRQAGEQAHQHPVEAVLLGRAGAAGRAKHRMPLRRPDQQQIARIDRHAEMLDAAANRLQRRGDHVAPVGDRRSAEDDDELGALLEHLAERAGERRTLVRYAPLGDDRGIGGRQPLGGDFQRLLDDLGR